MTGTLGADYRKLWSAAAVSTLGDGVREAALPLLAAILTRDPVQVAAVAFAGRLPWLLFTLVSGAMVDRLDRRRVMWSVDSVRAAAMLVLAVVVRFDAATIPVLVAVAFVLGTGETLFDNAAQALMPALVPRADLETANSRLYVAQVASLEFAGPPLGSLLFAAAATAPFFLDAGSFAVAVVLVLSMHGTYRAVRPAGLPPTHLRSEIGEGLRWLWRHRLLRTLALMLGVWNLVETATLSIFVLFALQDLHVSQAGYGLLFTGGAVGSVLGSLVSTRVIRRIGRAGALRAAMLVSGAATLVVATTSNAYVVGVMGAIGAFVVINWNVITVSLRQSIVPDALLGRVNSVYRFLGWGMMPLGAALGGGLAGAFGLRAPFWVAGAVPLVMLVLTLPIVNERTIAAARADVSGG